MPLIKDRFQGTGLLCFKIHCHSPLSYLSPICPPPVHHNATDVILLNCGATSTTTSLDGRKWEADLLFKYSPFNDQNASSPSNASSERPPCSHGSLLLWTYYF
ncbi:hypothetical protein SLA2020_360040 [Shorea laevis]